MTTKIAKTFAAVIVALAMMSTPASVLAAEQACSQGSRASSIALDLVVGRPTLALATVSGTILYAISLPLTLPSGAERDARDRLVTTPWNLLVSPLGSK